MGEDDEGRVFQGQLQRTWGQNQGTGVETGEGGGFGWGEGK